MDLPLCMYFSFVTVRADLFYAQMNSNLHSFDNSILYQRSLVGKFHES